MNKTFLATSTRSDLKLKSLIYDVIARSISVSINVVHFGQEELSQEAVYKTKMLSKKPPFTLNYWLGYFIRH